MDSKQFRVELAKRGLNQLRLASAIGVSPSVISYFVQGHYRPSEEVQARIASYLEMSREELFPEKREEA